jgi:hypothetical protein
MKQCIYILGITIFSLSGLCFSDQPVNAVVQNKWTLHLQHTIGNEMLELGKTYTNILGEELVVNRCRYYLSNFSVIDAQGQITILPAKYYLVDVADTASTAIVLSVPSKKISTIRFLLGVDSIRNVAGIQSGTLDPMRGMFWTWNSGYIMAQLEGTSPLANTAGHRFTYHIGGYKNGENATRQITINLDEKDNASKTLLLKADINRWFKGAYNLHLGETPLCETPGKLAMNIADNYSHFFSKTVNN